ncbi:MAG: voltage-dependent potassium channel subunit beta [Chloroflexi bacterium]|nr:voltage-dependent potassium channel subunit beta [Chloroflexota bacterium]
MEYRRLGRSGLKVSALSLGSWVTFGNQIANDVAYECMSAALEYGVNFFDNAEGYAGGQSEIVMGNAIKTAGWRREDLVISTKIFWGGKGPNDTGLSHKHVIEGVNNALKRLQMDYVDLVFCHRPDPNTPIEETVRAMDIVVKQGKAFYWGTSEWSADEIRAAYGIAREYGLTPPLMEQPQYNLLHRDRVEKEYKLLYRDIGLGTTIFSPLASGLLSGKYQNGIPEESRAAVKGYEWLKDSVTNAERLAKVARLQIVANQLGISLAQMSLAWCLKNPQVSTVITGASKASQVHENMKALDVVPLLTSAVMDAIEGALQPA